MQIIEEKNNNLLKRKEIKAIVESGKNPSIEEANKSVAEQFKVKEERVVIKQVKGKFGRNTFLITANIYNSKEDKEKTEPKPKGKKGKEGEKRQEEARQENSAQETKPTEQAKPEEQPKEEQLKAKPEEEIKEQILN